MSDVYYVCDMCPKRYKTKSRYEQHVLSHEKGTPASTSTTESHDCPHCHKTYKLFRNYEKHLLIHLQTGAVNEKNHEVDVGPVVVNKDSDIWPEVAVVDETIPQYTLFEEEDEEQERLMLAAVMEMNSDPPAPETAAPINKKEVAPPKTPLALCSTCGKGYLTLDGYLNHRMSHALADAVAKAPPFEDMKEVIQRCASDVLSNILKCNPNPKSKNEKQLYFCATKMLQIIDSPRVVEFLSSLCDGLYACFNRTKKFLLPSHLREEYLRGAAVLFSNIRKREELKEKLMCALELSEQEADVDFFLTSVMRQVSNKLLAFIAHWLANGKDSPIVMSASLYSDRKQELDSLEFKQTIHYIAGANVKSILRCTWRKWGQNEDCRTIIKTLRENFLVGGPQEVEENEFMAWTLCQDRGKLIKVNDKALSFFLELSVVVQPLEHLDGSLHVDEVLEKFTAYPKIIFLWEDLIKESMPKTLSFRLLHSLITCFCNTWRSGIISRRMDELHSKKAGTVLGTSGVSFRPKVVMSTRN